MLYLDGQRVLVLDCVPVGSDGTEHVANKFGCTAPALSMQDEIRLSEHIVDYTTILML